MVNMPEYGQLKKDNLERIFIFFAYFVLIFWAVLMIIPMIWMYLSAFTPEHLLIDIPPKISIKYFTTSNFKMMFDLAPETWRWYWNTLYLCVVITLLSIFFNALAGYCFAKLRFPGKKVLFWTIIATMIVPTHTIVIPLFVMVSNVFRLFDTHWAIILPQLSAPVGIFLMKQYMQSLPSDLEDAARIDGCSEPGIFFRIVLPLCKPIISVWAIFVFIANWKNFFWPLVVLNTPAKFVIEVGLATLQQQYSTRYGIVMAGAALASIPMIIVFFIFQKELTKGLALGSAIKG